MTNLKDACFFRAICPKPLLVTGVWLKRLGVVVLASFALWLSTAPPLLAQCTHRVLYVFTGMAAERWLGYSVSGAGDVNGDGYADLIMGAPGWGPCGISSGFGQAYVHSGQTAALLHTFTGEAELNHFGVSVSGAGDVNGDGYADLIVGAHGKDAGGNRTGRAYVFSGKTGDTLYTFTGEADGDEFGYSVSGGGDVDNDGYADLIVGAHWNAAAGSDAGRAYVYSGQTGALLYTFTGEAAWDNFGVSVSGAGDVDGDGYDDLIVGARGNDGGGDLAGRVYVYSGKTGDTLYTFTGEAAINAFGRSVSGAGDVNGDGYSDLIIGAPLNGAGGTEAGRAYVFSGQTGDTLYTFTGEAAYDNFGGSVCGAGDVNDDGYPDLIVATDWNDAGSSNAGRVYVYSGQTGGLLYTFTGEAAGDWLGCSISGAGDVDGDGYDDLIVGAVGNDAGDTDAGRVYVYSCQEPYLCGDVNDDREVDLADIVYFINYLFQGGSPPECLTLYTSCADPTGDDEVGLTDVVYLINYVLKSGPPPIC
jgi:hypothetical protein